MNINDLAKELTNINEWLEDAERDLEIVISKKDSLRMQPQSRTMFAPHNPSLYALRAMRPEAHARLVKHCIRVVRDEIKLAKERREQIIRQMKRKQRQSKKVA